MQSDSWSESNAPMFSGKNSKRMRRPIDQHHLLFPYQRHQQKTSSNYQIVPLTPEAATEWQIHVGVHHHKACLSLELVSIKPP